MVHLEPQSESHYISYKSTYNEKVLKMHLVTISNFDYGLKHMFDNRKQCTYYGFNNNPCLMHKNFRGQVQNLLPSIIYGNCISISKSFLKQDDMGDKFSFHKSLEHFSKQPCNRTQVLPFLFPFPRFFNPCHSVFARLLVYPLSSVLKTLLCNHRPSQQSYYYQYRRLLSR